MQINHSQQIAKYLTKIKTELNLLLIQRADLVIHKTRPNHYGRATQAA